MLSTHHSIFGGLIRIFSFSNMCSTYSVSVTAVNSFKVRKGYHLFHFIDGETEANGCSDLPRLYSW